MLASTLQEIGGKKQVTALYSVTPAGVTHLKSVKLFQNLTVRTEIRIWSCQCFQNFKGTWNVGKAFHFKASKKTLQTIGDGVGRTWWCSFKLDKNFRRSVLNTAYWPKPGQLSLVLVLWGGKYKYFGVKHRTLKQIPKMRGTHTEKDWNDVRLISLNLQCFCNFTFSIHYFWCQ